MLDITRADLIEIITDAENRIIAKVDQSIADSEVRMSNRMDTVMRDTEKRMSTRINTSITNSENRIVSIVGDQLEIIVNNLATNDELRQLTDKMDDVQKNSEMTLQILETGMATVVVSKGFERRIQRLETDNTLLKQTVKKYSQFMQSK